MLSVVSTPIGNLGDITRRAIEALTRADAIVCEDTRVTGNLLKQLQIAKKEIISLHGYSKPGKADALVKRLRNGEHLALVSDAGTPGISDPGYALISRTRAAGLEIEAIPGPSAFLTALSVSGLPMNQFLYLGFLPQKKGRQTLLHSLQDEKRTVVFYESVHRIEQTLNDLAEHLGAQPNRAVVVARELTKVHEEVTSATVQKLPSIAGSITKKGEFVVIVGPSTA